MFSTIDKVAESNRIEGIVRPPTQAELDEFDRFMSLKTVTVEDMEAFVKVYQPKARLRDSHGLDVRVGSYYPPKGGVGIRYGLADILIAANEQSNTAWNIHVDYETLHPFTDGNGRSGRMLWYWMMRGWHMADLGFLHAFYYQTLNHTERRWIAPKL